MSVDNEIKNIIELHVVENVCEDPFIRLRHSHHSVERIISFFEIFQLSITMWNKILLIMKKENVRPTNIFYDVPR
jgi:hypothetical protein